MSLKKLLGSCANGIKVFDRPNSHSNVHSVSIALIKEALLKISPNKNFVVEVINFNRIIGKTNCVSVDKTDTVVMAYRHGRKGPTPMVLNREPEDCSSLTVILKKDHNSGNYILITAFFGDSSEKEPWDPSIIPDSEEHQKAKDFWATHALVYDPSTIAQMA